jgi:hypothetical protein
MEASFLTLSLRGGGSGRRGSPPLASYPCANGPQPPRPPAALRPERQGADPRDPSWPAVSVPIACPPGACTPAFILTLAHAAAASRAVPRVAPIVSGGGAQPAHQSRPVFAFALHCLQAGPEAGTGTMKTSTSPWSRRGFGCAPTTTRQAGTAHVSLSPLSALISPRMHPLPLRLRRVSVAGDAPASTLSVSGGGTPPTAGRVR